MSEPATCATCGQALPAGASAARRWCDRCRGAIRYAPEHVVASSRLRVPAAVECSCGACFDAPEPEAAAAAFAAHTAAHKKARPEVSR